MNTLHLEQRGNRIAARHPQDDALLRQFADESGVKTRFARINAEDYDKVLVAASKHDFCLFTTFAKEITMATVTKNRKTSKVIRSSRRAKTNNPEGVKPQWAEGTTKGAFLPKVGKKIGYQITRKFMAGNSLGKIAKELDLAIGTVRYHMLQYMIEKYLGKGGDEEGGEE